MIRKVATRQEGNRPSRSIFEITAAGRKEFLRLLRGSWREIERHHFSIDLGIAFMRALPDREIKKYLTERIGQLVHNQKRLRGHKSKQLGDPQVPASARSIFDHSAAHLDAELVWTRDLLGKIDRGDMK